MAAVNLAKFKKVQTELDTSEERVVTTESFLIKQRVKSHGASSSQVFFNINFSHSFFINFNFKSTNKNWKRSNFKLFYH